MPPARPEGSPGISQNQYDDLRDTLRESSWPATATCCSGALRKNTLDDVDRSADTMRCLSLDDGREIWHNGYPVVVPHNHGMSRTIPAVVGDTVVSLGPKCQVAGWDAADRQGPLADGPGARLRRRRCPPGMPASAR